MKLVTRLAVLAAVCLAPVALQAQQPEFPEVAKPCITCHGRDGIGRSPGFPNIAGQKPIYMMEQLTHFRNKTRQSEVMNITTANLTDDDIRAIAEYYAAQSPCKQ